MRALRQPARAPLTIGHDLLPGYAAGTLVRTGRHDRLYDPAAIEDVARDVVRDANLTADPRTAAWVNPPAFALAFAPLSSLPYRTAAGVYLAVLLTCLSIAIVLLCRILTDVEPRDRPINRQLAIGNRQFPTAARPDWRSVATLPLLLLASVPFWQALTHLQNTFFSLAVLTVAIALVRGGRPFAGGLAAGLLVFKPQLGLAVWAILAVVVGRRVVAGILLAAGAIVLAGEWTMPGSLAAFVRGAPPIVRHLQTSYEYNWARQVTLHGFWRLIVQGTARGETWPAVKVLWAVTWLPLAAALAVAAWRTLRSRGPVPDVVRDRLIGAAVVSMPLLMPYFMDYDLLLLAVPAVLFAREAVGTGAVAWGPLDRCTTVTWVTAYVAVAVSSVVGTSAGFHVAVAAFVPLAVLSVARCLRPATDPATIASREVDAPADPGVPALVPAAT